MTREQIEKAAKKYAAENLWYPGETSYESDIREMEESFADAFKAGAQWRINAVWHDAHEEPQRSGMLIASNEDGNYILCGPNNSNWKQTVKLFRIMNWAYIIDLLPEKKEGWVNVYKNNLYDTESKARAYHIESGYIATAKVTWEE